MKKIILAIVFCFSVIFGGCGDAGVSSQTEYSDSGVTQDAGPQTPITVSWARSGTRSFCRNARYINFNFNSIDHRVQYSTIRNCEVVTSNGTIGNDRFNEMRFLVPQSTDGQIYIEWANGSKTEVVRNIRANEVVTIYIP